MAEQRLSAGDVLGFAIERVGLFGACQIVAVNAENKQVTVALLDWTGKQMPTLGDLIDSPRLAQDFMYGKGNEVVVNVSLPAPSRYHAIGKLPVHGSTESRTWGDWEFDDEIVLQRQWRALPDELTKAFKANIDSDQIVSIPGLLCKSSGEPLQKRVGHTSYFTDDAIYRKTHDFLITQDFRMASLRAWPLLSKIHLHAWREDLIAFLQSSPLVSELMLRKHGQREIDLSGTAISTLIIDIDRLERLVLPESLDTLIVHRTAEVSEEAPRHRFTQFVASQNGHRIMLMASGAVPPLRGLDQVRRLSVSGVSRLDLREVSNTFANINYLSLHGAPGTLSALASLSELPKLQTLCLRNLFGYAPEDFPTPDALAALTGLDLDSVPTEVAATVRKVYKGVSRVSLSVRNPRKPAWLAENLDYPLRDWEDRDEIAATTLKKVHKAYVTAMRQVREAEAAREDDAVYDDAVTLAISDLLEVVTGLNRKAEFLYTLERDELIAAVNLLAAHLSESAPTALDTLIEEALDD